MAAVLRSADVRITVTSPTSCQVVVGLAVDSPADIEHRIETLDGTEVELVGLRGARQVGDLRRIGRTLSLLLRSSQPAYELSYRTTQRVSSADRCPIWLPTVPADGQSRAVRLQIELPPGTTAGSSMPAFTWTGTHGVATLGHIPAVVRVPYAPSGEIPRWTTGSVMDAMAVAVFAGATAIWTWRLRR